MAGQIFFNGRYINFDKITVSADSPLLLYGFGLFESMRCLGGNIVYFDQHIARIRKSSKLLGIKFPYTNNYLKKIILHTVRLNGHHDSYVRLTISRAPKSNTDILVVSKEYNAFKKAKYSNGFGCCIWPIRQNNTSFLCRLKTTNYIPYLLSYEHALGRGFDEALLLNTRGYICEASRSNIFFVHGKNLFTPSLDCGCLEGVTREAILDMARKEKIKVWQGNFTLDNLYYCEEAFLTNSLMGVMPLTSVEKKRIGNGKPGPVTEFLMRKYSGWRK